jgi:hypothetical protein
MKIVGFCVLALIFGNAIAGEPDYILGKTQGTRVPSLWVLPDRGYDITRVAEDTTLRFQKDLAIEYGKFNAYWIRCTIANPSRYGSDCLLWLHPQVDNTFYNFNLDSGRWVSQRCGLVVADHSRLTAMMPFSIPADTVCVYYILADISRLSSSSVTANPALHIYTADSVSTRETWLKVIWLGTLSVILVFFLYNAFVWYSFRDKAYQYYLLIQLGSMVYITGFHRYYNLTPFRLVDLHLRPNGNLYFYDLNNKILEIAVVMIITGFVQLTRKYLETKDRLPVWDKILRYFNYAFSGLTLISLIVTTSGIFYLSYYTIFYVNLGAGVIILLMLVTGILMLRKKYKPSKYFLLANAVPLVIMFVLAGYLALYSFNDNVTLLLPSLAIISQSVALAIALVARVQLLKDELHNQQLTVQMERSRNEKLQEKLQYNQRELASSAMFSFQKNKLLADLKRDLEVLSEETAGPSNLTIKKLRSTIQSNMLLDAEWEKFKLHFEQVHPDFFHDLKAAYPNLTQNEIRLSAYFRINLSVKEIAALTNIDPESVRKAKTRLNKKINQAEPNTVE